MQATVSHPVHAPRSSLRRLLIMGNGMAYALAGWLSITPIALGELLTPPLEQRFARTQLGDVATVAGVIALGGGDERIREACRLASVHPHLRVFVSGNGEADAVRRSAGPEFNGCRFELENSSYNTRTNAIFTRQALRPAAGERWLLVTSAGHMPRAIGAFRKVGMDVEAWPVDDSWRGKVGSARAAGHEWLGLMSYWLRGHSSELFPAPSEVDQNARRDVKARIKAG